MTDNHDSSYKLLFSHPEMVKAFLSGFIDPEYIQYFDLDSLEKQNGSYVADDLRDRADDLVWRLKCKDEWVYLYLLLEFQSTVDRWMPVRVGTYCGLLYQDIIQTQNLGWDDQLPAILPIVIYNGRYPWRASTDLASLMEPIPAVFKPLQLNVSYVLVDEGRYTNEELADNENIAAILFRLENSQTAEAFDHGLTCLVEWCKQPERASLKRAFTVWMKRVLLKKLPTQDVPDFSELEEGQTMLSERMDDWQENWKKEGIEQGIVESKRDDILDALEIKFSNVPDNIALIVNESTDPIRLKEMLHEAIRSESLDTFQKWLEK
ncbi:MAG: transposase [Methylococcales bacterium]|jgi:hypothetical protein|nr:transposase [Methylococcales bacterium]MBT7445535.1 transposase [Methylococcales bacterium]